MTTILLREREAMHRPTLLEGVLVALVLSLSLGPLVVFCAALGSAACWPGR